MLSYLYAMIFMHKFYEYCNVILIYCKLKAIMFLLNKIRKCLLNDILIYVNYCYENKLELIVFLITFVKYQIYCIKII